MNCVRAFHTREGMEAFFIMLKYSPIPARFAHAYLKPYKQPPDVTLDKYGLTLEQHIEMWLAQDGKCLICYVDEFDLGKRRLHIDHNHTTGFVRGLLCSNCNTAIGMFEDDIYRMEKAIQYLRDARSRYIEAKNKALDTLRKAV